MSRTVTLYLKGRYAPGDKDWDRAYVRAETSTQITLQDNEYGLNVRTYQKTDVARIDER